MGVRLAVAAMLIVAMACAGFQTEAATPIHSGVYQSLRYVEESGDLLGLEVEVRAGLHPSIVVTDCEGCCCCGKAWPLIANGGRLDFTVTDDLVDQAGRPLRGKPIRYVGLVRGTTIILTSPDLDGFRETLKKVRHPKPDQTARLACEGSGC